MDKYIIGAVLASLIGMGFWIDYRAKESVREEFEAQVASAKETSLILRKSNDLALGKKNAEIETINSKLALLRGELRKRPSRSTAPSSSTSCTGRELLREDAEFLAGEAARAEQIMKERNYYYERYEEARQMLERIQNGKD